jgi:hypothetical protein
MPAPIVTDYPVADLEPGDEANYTEVATRQGQVAHETPAAIKFLLDDTAHWVPRSQIRRDHMGRLHVADWFIEENDIGA